MAEDVKRINEVIVIMVGSLTLGVDVLCAILDSFGVGLGISPVLQGFTTFSTTWILKAYGDKNALSLGRQVTKYLANVLPWLPTNTVAFGIEVYMHNHPEKFGAIQKVAGLASGKPNVIASKS